MTKWNPELVAAAIVRVQQPHLPPPPPPEGRFAWGYSKERIAEIEAHRGTVCPCWGKGRAS
jgi:hypothetical protein